MHAKSLQLCLTLCNTMDCNQPGSSVLGILQARILEWVTTCPPLTYLNLFLSYCVILNLRLKIYETATSFLQNGHKNYWLKMILLKKKNGRKHRDALSGDYINVRNVQLYIILVILGLKLSWVT